MKDLIEKINSFGPTKLSVDFDLNSPVCVELPDNVPSDYLEYLEKYPYTVVFEKEVKFKAKIASPWSSAGIEALEVLYGFSRDKNNNLFTLIENEEKGLPHSMLPIGQATGANYICMSLRDYDYGCVYILDHERFDEANGLFLIETSFEKFLELLRIGEVECEGQSELKTMSLSVSLQARIAEALKKKDYK